jgi:multiple sugar transport system ATP-binding protein
MDDAALVTRQEGSGTLRVVVDLREALGSDVLVHFRLNAPPVLTEDTKELAHDSETAVPLRAEEQERSIFVARLNARSRVREGDTVDLAVDTRGLHFFDPDTGASIRATKPT